MSIKLFAVLLFLSQVLSGFSAFASDNEMHIQETFSLQDESTLTLTSDYLDALIEHVINNNEAIYGEAIKAAQEALSTRNLEFEARGTAIFFLLCQNNYAPCFPIALQIAEKFSSDDNERDIDLLLMLVIHNYQQAYEIALTVAQDRLCKNDYDAQITSFHVLGRLICKDYNPACAPGLVAAQQAIASDNPEIYQLGLMLFFSLTAYSHVPAYESALKAAQEASKSDNPEILILGFQIFRDLIVGRHRTSYAPALVAVEEELKKNNSEVNETCFDILINLISIEYEEAYALACNIGLKVIEVAEFDYEESYTPTITKAQ